MEVAAKSRNKIRKPPTRLQMQAPASLELDQIVKTTNPFTTTTTTSSSLIPIPLLSPLVVSPQPLSQEVEEFKFPVSNLGNDRGREDFKDGSCSEERLPQQAAVAGIYMEPSPLYSLFQSKCLLVNRAQWGCIICRMVALPNGSRWRELPQTEFDTVDSPNTRNSFWCIGWSKAIQLCRIPCKHPYKYCSLLLVRGANTHLPRLSINIHLRSGNIFRILQNLKPNIVDRMADNTAFGTL